MAENFTPQQKRKLQKLAKLVKDGNYAILEHLFEIEEKIDQEIPEIKDVISRVKGDQGQKGDKGDQGERGSEGVRGEKGDSIIGPKGDRGTDGINGLDGRDGIDGNDGLNGRDGKDGRDGVDGRDAPIVSTKRLDELEQLLRNQVAVPVTTTNFFKNSQLVGRAKNINFVDGTNTTTSVSVSGDVANVSINSTASGGGSSFQVPTGTVNGTNQTFIFTTAPNAVVVDGERTIRQTSSDGTSNWTGTTTITLSIAPNFDIFSIA